MSVLHSSLNLNDLVYLGSTPAATTIQRNLRKFYPEKTVYGANEKMVIRLHGNQFVDMPNSSLRFQIRPVGSDLVFSNSSVVNAFRRVRVVSPSGKVISDSINNNLLQRMNIKLERSFDNAFLVGPAYGHSSESDTTLLDGLTYEFVVPMRFISPFWNNEQLLPPVMSEDLILEFYFENLTEVGKSAGGGALTAYVISDPQLIVDAVLMTDPIWKALHDMKDDIMVYEYLDYVHEETSLSISSNKGEIRSSQPLSNALEAFTTLRNSDIVHSEIESSFQTVNIPMTVPSPVDQMEYRWGDVNLPQQPANGGPQIFNILLHARGQLSSSRNDDYSLSKTNFQSVNNSYACYAVNLRTSKVFNNSGREISNQNLLLCRFTHDRTLITGLVDMFIKHVARIVIKGGVVDVER